MTKAEYVQKLIDLCTPEQQGYLRKQYPRGFDKQYIRGATNYVENLLKTAAKKMSDTDLAKIKAEETILEYEKMSREKMKVVRDLMVKIEQLENELKEIKEAHFD